MPSSSNKMEHFSYRGEWTNVKARLQLYSNNFSFINKALEYNNLRYACLSDESLFMWPSCDIIVHL